MRCDQSTRVRRLLSLHIQLPILPAQQPRNASFPDEPANLTYQYMMSDTADAVDTGEKMSGPLGELLKAAWKLATGVPWFTALYGAPSSDFGLVVDHYPALGRRWEFYTDLLVTTRRTHADSTPEIRVGAEMLKERYEALLQRLLRVHENNLLNKPYSWDFKDVTSSYQIGISEFPDEASPLRGVGPSCGPLEDAWEVITRDPGFSSQNKYRRKPEFSA